MKSGIEDDFEEEECVCICTRTHTHTHKHTHKHTHTHTHTYTHSHTHIYICIPSQLPQRHAHSHVRMDKFRSELKLQSNGLPAKSKRLLVKVCRSDGRIRSVGENGLDPIKVFKTD